VNKNRRGTETESSKLGRSGELKAMFSGEEEFVIVALGCANDEASMN
jgi:hypothetical protein